jgi:MFS family permease
MIFKSESFYTNQFWLLCFSNFLFSASFQMLIPELPAYLTKLGGDTQIGLLIALFTLTAGLSRPFSGKITDSLGRIPVMAFGSLVCFGCGLLYPWVSTVFGLLSLRFVHGFSTGTKPTATSAYVADIVPEANRGQAAGMVGVFHALGFSVGPALGSVITNHYSINTLFYTSSVFALLSIIILANMKETLLQKQAFKLALFRVSWADVFDKRVLVVFLIMLFLNVPNGIMITLAPDHSVALGILNKGLFFTLFTVASLLVRVFFSKTSDKHGRRIVMIYTILIMILAMVVISFYQNIYAFYIGAILFGVSMGMSSPTLTAWVIDLSLPQYRGRAFATMYIGLELGIGLGAIAAGYLIRSLKLSFNFAYCLGAMMALCALLSIFVVEKNRKSTHNYGI